MAKKINRKFVLANAFQEMKESIIELEAKLMWHSWDEATETGFAARQKIQRRLNQILLTYQQLQEFVTGKEKHKDEKTQGTRMLKCECEECGYILRTTFMNICRAIPICPDPDCDRFQEPMQHEEPQTYSETKVRDDAKESHIKARLEGENETIETVVLSETASKHYADPFADLPGSSLDTWPTTEKGK